MSVKPMKKELAFAVSVFRNEYRLRFRPPKEYLDQVLKKSAYEPLPKMVLICSGDVCEAHEKRIGVRCFRFSK